jgi:ParB/RepB/Spo0J family partition protein
MSITTQPEAGAAVTAAAAPSFGDIPLACIRASKTNPRKIFNDDDLNDLARSIKVQGVAQPILVRPIEVIDDVTYFEIVAGERRFRASGLAGMPTVPAIVRELSDQQAYEIQVLENLQRVDLHPLEEAEGFEVMMATYKVTADELAEKTGKSKAYIYASLKLCALEPGPRKAFYEGKLTKSTALLVARIPVKSMQIKCTAEITEGWQGPASTRDAASHITRTYMLALGKATFASEDPDLHPTAGACGGCPKRAGNQPIVFADVNADVCTDPVCFNAKNDAHAAKMKAAALARGLAVVSGPEAKKIMPYEGARLQGGYVRLADKNFEDDNARTYREILGEADVPLALLESPNGQLVEVVKIADIKPLLAEKGIGVRQAEESSKSKAREQALAAKAKIEQEFRRQLFEATHHASLMMNLVDADLRLVACQVFSRIGGGTIAQATVLRLHGWTRESISYGRSGSLRAAVDALSPAQLNQFIRDCVLCSELETFSYTPNDPPENLLAFAERAKVDAKKIRSDIDAAAKAKAESKKKAGEKKAAAAMPTRPASPAQTTKAKKTQPATTKAAAMPAAAKPAKRTRQVQEALPIDSAAWPFPTSSGAGTAVKATQ